MPVQLKRTHEVAAGRVGHLFSGARLAARAGEIAAEVVPLVWVREQPLVVAGHDLHRPQAEAIEVIRAMTLEDVRLKHNPR